MDPLSVGASVGSLSGACIVTLKNLNELLGKFRDAPKTLRDLSSETKIISISLSNLRNVLISDEHSVLTQSLLKPDIRSALDIALTGCNVTLSCIETEIHSLTVNIATGERLSFSDRAKVAWKEDKFKELLQQLNRQHSAIATLNQSFQMKAIADILYRIGGAGNRALIQKVAEDTKSLRGRYPKSNAAKSFLDSLESAGANETNLSMISESQFEFDDVVTNSQAYRRVMVAATHVLKKNMGGDVVGVGDAKEVAPEGGDWAKGNNTESANQSRKMSAVPFPARSLKHSPIANPVENPGLQDNHSQQSTINDPHSFAQQIRGYLDHVEGESRNTAKENADLRERLEEKEIATKAVVTHLTKRAELAETELDIASKNNAEMVLEVQRLRETAKLLEAASTQKDRQLDKLQSRIIGLNKKITSLSNLANKCADRGWKAEGRLKVAEVEVDSLRSKLREEEAETASAKRELEELRALEKDLSALFQKGNDIIQDKRKQVIDREK